MEAQVKILTPCFSLKVPITCSIMRCNGVPNLIHVLDPDPSSQHSAEILRVLKLKTEKGKYPTARSLSLQCA